MGPVMTGQAEALRRQAQKCRRLASEIGDRLADAALTELAADLDRRAETAEHLRSLPPVRLKL